MPRFYQYSAQIPVAVIYDGDAMRYESSATCIGGDPNLPCPTPTAPIPPSFAQTHWFPLHPSTNSSVLFSSFPSCMSLYPSPARCFTVYTSRLVSFVYLLILELLGSSRVYTCVCICFARVRVCVGVWRCWCVFVCVCLGVWRWVCWRVSVGVCYNRCRWVCECVCVCDNVWLRVCVTVCECVYTRACVWWCTCNRVCECVCMRVILLSMSLWVICPLRQSMDHFLYVHCFTWTYNWMNACVTFPYIFYSINSHNVARQNLELGVVGIAGFSNGFYLFKWGIEPENPPLPFPLSTAVNSTQGRVLLSDAYTLVYTLLLLVKDS